MKVNEIYTAPITGMSAESEGIARVDGEAVFVPGAIVGETCRFRIVNIGKSCAHGVLKEVVEPSPHRIEPDCPFYKKCGGCDYRHMDYEMECACKRQRVYDALTRIGGVEPFELEIVGAETTRGYRNKVQYPVREQNGRSAAGFFSAGTHRVTEVTHCLIQPNCADRVRGAVLRWMEQYRIRAYEETTHSGYVRQIYLRVGAVSGEVLVCIVANCESLPKKKALCACLRESVPEVSSIVVSYNQKRGNTVLGDRYETLYGSGMLEDTLCGLRFRLSVPAFYQVNHDQAERLYRKALEYAALRKDETALDLYCGSGTITLCLAREAKSVIGVELVAEAIEDAKENARRNGIENAEFYCMDAGAAAQKFAQAGQKPDVIVVDPPRKGLSEDVIEAITRMAPERLVYVSCDPATLARDVRRLSPRYRFRKAEALDLFPRCKHVETVCLLSKLSDAKHHVEVELNLDEMDLTSAESKATYEEIKAYVQEHAGLNVSKLYIAQTKRKCGIIERENYNLPKSEDSRQPQCPPEKEAAIKEALKHFGMI